MNPDSPDFHEEPPHEPWADSVVETGLVAAIVAVGTLGALAAQWSLEASADAMIFVVQNGIANFMYPN